ncbi:MAG: TetR family transcriptional regulator [Gammaproteobacteria bacterium]|nr:TetR family transcriptional regulator [Gammaproteobacteria bacterium]MBU1408649.1 TetR family transcriptional regulator [Gammaproteobacteria bacterium]MBU1532461.1 TetR family transcriptional regulator [Gammaproteobacteria bacterium]
MVKKTREEARATRESLLVAALQVFRERGVAHTRLSDVAERAGVTRGAIYWHFKDKAELFQAVCERGTLPVEALLAEASQSVQRDPLATVRQLALMALTRLAQHADTQAMFDVIFHKCEFTEELAPVVAKNDADRAACLSRVQQLFNQAVACGQLPPTTDTFLATQGMHAYMVGLMHEWVLNPQNYDLAACAGPLLDCYLAGLATRPPLCRPDAG